MKFKEGNTVYLKAQVVRIERSGFEIGHGHHHEDFVLDIPGIMFGLIAGRDVLYTKESMLKELEKATPPKVGGKYRMKAPNPDLTRTLTVKHVTDKSVFFEYDDSEGHGFATKLSTFSKEYVEVV